MSKRLFQILDEMNVADGENNTAHVAISNHLVSAQTAKGGGHVTMGVEASYIHKLAVDDNCIALLVIVDKKEYDKARLTESASKPTDWNYQDDESGNNQEETKTFICEDCGKELPISKKCHSDYDVCDECLEYYENKTGYCSVHCRINGSCDDSC